MNSIDETKAYESLTNHTLTKYDKPIQIYSYLRYLNAIGNQKEIQDILERPGMLKKMVDWIINGDARYTASEDVNANLLEIIVFPNLNQAIAMTLVSDIEMFKEVCTNFLMKSDFLGYTNKWYAVVEKIKDNLRIDDAVEFNKSAIRFIDRLVYMNKSSYTNIPVEEFVEDMENLKSPFSGTSEFNFILQIPGMIDKVGKYCKRVGKLEIRKQIWKSANEMVAIQILTNDTFLDRISYADIFSPIHSIFIEKYQSCYTELKKLADGYPHNDHNKHKFLKMLQDLING